MYGEVKGRRVGKRGERAPFCRSLVTHQNTQNG